MEGTITLFILVSLIKIIITDNYQDKEDKSNISILPTNTVIEKLDLVSTVGFDIFYKKAILNKITIKLKLNEFNAEAWTPSLEILLKYQAELAENNLTSRLYYLVTELIMKIRTLHTNYKLVSPFTQLVEPPEDNNCNLELEIFSTITQNNGVRRYALITRELGTSLLDPSKEGTYFSILQNAVRHVQDFYSTLNYEMEAFENIVFFKNFEPIQQHINNEIKALECLTDFSRDTLYIPNLVAINQKEDIINCVFTLTQFFEPTKIVKMIFNNIGNYFLNEQGANVLHSMNNQIMIFSESTLPLNPLTPVKFINPDCKEAIMKNELVNAVPLCNLLLKDDATIIKFKQHGLKINLQYILNDELRQFHKYSSILIKTPSINLTTPLGKAKIHLHDNINTIKHRHLTQIEISRLKEINELYLLWLLFFLPFIIIPLIVTHLKKRKLEKKIKRLDIEQEKALKLLDKCCAQNNALPIL
jgi:hypothetical protein